MNDTIKRLLEQANAPAKNEDGTVADLGPAPTGHKTHLVNCSDEDEKEDGR